MWHLQMPSMHLPLVLLQFVQPMCEQIISALGQAPIIPAEYVIPVVVFSVLRGK